MAVMVRLEPPLAFGVEGPVSLLDGTEVTVRVARSADKELLLRFLQTVSSESLGLRFFGAMRPETACDLLLLEGPRQLQLSLLALSRGPAQPVVIGQAEYVRANSITPVAEVAFLIGDAWRGRGLGTILLHRLAQAAIGVGVREFEARVLPENLEMLEVFRGSGYTVRETHSSDEVRVKFPITEPPVASDTTIPGAWRLGSSQSRRTG
jgi:acetate---CoA ligase (ADP-forming)